MASRAPQRELKVPVDLIRKMEGAKAAWTPAQWDKYRRQLQQEKAMEAVPVKKGGLTISRVILWKSPDGKHCVISGPFPDGLFRSDTRRSVREAAKRLVGDMYVHEETDRADRYAKVLTKDVLEILSGENEFGEVSP